MNTNHPEQIREQISALLARLPDLSDITSDITAEGADLDAVGAQLEDAHEVLVRALELVEKG